MHGFRSTFSYIFLPLLFVLPQMSCFSEESDPIVVRLATENPLIPVYLAKIVDDNSQINRAYLDQLEEILRFDLNHNGMTQTAPASVDKEKLANQLSTEHSVNTDAWKASRVLYVIKVHVDKEKALSTLMLSINSHSIKTAQGLKLTQDLSQDRRLMHQIADLIHKTLFGTDGIATTRILYTIKKKNPLVEGSSGWVSEVWESDYDGGNARKVIADSGYHLTPVYITPRSGFTTASLLYVSYKTSQPKIYAASIRGGESHRLMTLKGNQLMPAVSRQRDKIAFISDVTGNPDLFLQDFNPEVGVTGKPRMIFTSKQASQGSPAFSPDGERIAFVSNKDGSPRIYVMDIPPVGTSIKDLRPQLLTKHSKESSAPSWSPDGNKIAYCAKVDGTRQIWVYDCVRKEERQLTQGSVNKENPSWAPNSLSLVYNTTDTGSCDLYLINLNQSNATKITSGVGEKRFPNWEPR